jgi:hypothetical protein
MVRRGLSDTDVGFADDLPTLTVVNPVDKAKSRKLSI